MLSTISVLKSASVETWSRTFTGWPPLLPSTRVHSITLSGFGSPEATPCWKVNTGLLSGVVGGAGLAAGSSSPPQAVSPVVATVTVTKLPHFKNLRRSMSVSSCCQCDVGNANCSVAV
ncbi:hypothetical protein D3C85_1341250 [compost metagenome]